MKYAIIHESKMTENKTYFVCEDDKMLCDAQDLCGAYCRATNEAVWVKVLRELELQGIEVYTLAKGEDLPMSLNIIQHEIYRF